VDVEFVNGKPVQTTIISTVRLSLPHEAIFDLWVARPRSHLPEH
jgi:hypothetical protein